MLNRVMGNISCCNLDNGDMLREVMMNIGLEIIDTQEEVIVEVLSDSGATRLVMSLENKKTNICKKYRWFF